MASESAPARLNQLAEILGSKSYLEIGVQKGLTFNNINVIRKDAVDPKFMFKYKDIESDCIKLHEIESDLYFEKISSSGPQVDTTVFDLFFIDGMHTYDQTYRDFCNCLALSSSKAFFVIDDTEPADLYSSLRRQSTCKLRRSREAPNSNIKEWRGDTYKIILLINFFHTSYSYCTVKGGGPAQTFVWKTSLIEKEMYESQPYKISKLSNEILFEYLGRINELDYNWFLDTKDELMQECSTEDFMEWFGNAFNNKS